MNPYMVVAMIITMLFSMMSTAAILSDHIILSAITYGLGGYIVFTLGVNMGASLAIKHLQAEFDKAFNESSDDTKDLF